MSFSGLGFLGLGFLGLGFLGLGFLGLGFLGLGFLIENFLFFNAPGAPVVSGRRARIIKSANARPKSHTGLIQYTDACVVIPLDEGSPIRIDETHAP